MKKNSEKNCKNEKKMLVYGRKWAESRADWRPQRDPRKFGLCVSNYLYIIPPNFIYGTKKTLKSTKNFQIAWSVVRNNI